MKFLALVFVLCATAAQALPLPGMNTFEVSCFSIYDRQVDPIVQPAVEPSMHLHRFTGAVGIDSLLQAQTGADAAQQVDLSLTLYIRNPASPGFSNVKDPGYFPPRAGGSTCVGYGWWGGYWSPASAYNGDFGPNYRGFTLLDRDNYPRTAGGMKLTWAAPVGVPVYPAPYGMNFVVGNQHATTEAEQDNAHVGWTCGTIDPKDWTTAPRDCSSEWGTPGVVTGVTMFPDCWDGLGSYPHFDSIPGIARSHFFYSTGGDCGQGVHIAQLFMSVNFGDLDTRRPLVNPFNGDGSWNLTFSSGGYPSYHTDAFILESVSLGAEVYTCLNHQSYEDLSPASCALPRCPSVFTGNDLSTLVVCKDQD